MSRFDFILKYIPGAKMGKADGLSKKLDWKVEIKKDNKLIIEEWIHSLAEIVIGELEVDIIEK